MEFGNGIHEKKEGITEMKKWSKKKKGVVIAAGVALLGLAGIYGYQVSVYQNHFLPGTRINELDCGKMTAKEAEDAYRKETETYQLTLTFRGDESETIAGKDFDYTYQDDGEIESFLKKQNPFLWMKYWFEQSEYELKRGIVYDEDKLEKKLNNLSHLSEELQEAPVDAKIVYKEDQFVVKKEKQGTTIDTDALGKAVEQALKEGEETLDVEQADGYVKPVVTKDSELLAKQKKQLNELANVQVTYELPEGEKVLNGNTIKKWLNLDEDGNYSLDQDKMNAKIKKYVKKLAEEVDTLGKERPFHTTSGLDVTVTGGNYGWKIDQKAEIKVLKKNIKNQQQVTRKPEYSQKELYTDNHGLGDTYIEVNLTEQHLYYYKKGKVVLDTPFVSGRMTKDRFTPPGVYFLTYKQKDRILRGRPNASGQPSYQSHVNYWMPFNGGIGLHDASWRSSFGGKIYIYSGSHGCINLPGKKAAKIYEMINKETPIVCVYNNGYKLHG